MTLWSINSRDAVRESEVERRLRRGETSGRRIASAMASRSSPNILCRIRWNITAGGDLSDGDVVDDTGTALGRTVSVEAFQSIQAVRPEYFGDVIYECEPIGLVVSTVPASKRRMLVRAIRFFGFGAGTVSRPTSVLVTAVPGGTDTICKIVGIQTSVNGSLHDIFVNLSNAWLPYSPLNFAFSTSLPVRWSIDDGACRILPDILQVGHRNGVASGSVSLGTNITLSGLSIEAGEACQLKVAGANFFGPTSQDVGETFNIADVQIRKLPSGYEIKGIVCGRGIHSQWNNPPTAVINGGGVNAINAVANPFTLGFWYATNTGSPTVTQAVSITVTLTVGGDGRITAIALVSNLAIHFSAVVYGGQGNAAIPMIP